MEEVLKIVNHDLRSPLTGIIGLTKVLHSEPDLELEDKEAMLEAMENSAGEVLDQANQLLVATTGSTDIHEIYLEPVNIREAAERHINTHLVIADRKKIDLEATLPPNGLVLNIDRKKMELVLSNLITNALKFTNAGGQIHVTLTPKGGDSISGLEIEVKDNGIGIPESIKPHLFERFGPQRRKGTFSEPSIGLGLSLVKHCLDALGGHIDVESAENNGSTFKALIPASIFDPE